MGLFLFLVVDLLVGGGECSVCGLVRAEWIDRQEGVKLCEHCYGREVRENA